ncbi:hypothetical protein GQ43DRAFT_77180 [Delitschia confertaspora ATCC 74209]|uniref:Glycosylphosphatidylinositol anchor biosynthesis protein 11 n=1 Tax=Delitschia confertaspora ATCC 74209 TaxID=1513339 RepID=A0A9P4MP90_9PLEO|nr:hypothetical protein GQ43DRAFT_77180 [Delitschia confertaspora ATCC 74209]
MSSSTSLTKASKAPKAGTSAVPIDVLHKDTAKLYTHIHPILLLSLYVFQFKSIVADPVPALVNTLIALGVLQIAYVSICLPPTGGSATPAPVARAGGKKKTAPGKLESGIQGKIIPAFLSLLLSTLAGTPVLAITLVLFGAPLTTHHAHTVLCAAHISFLAVLPAIYVYGVEGEKWRQIVAMFLPIDEVFGAMIGTVLGAWLGAVPIPLDWDREWQKWPVTIVTGAYIGYAVGKLLGGTLLKGKKIMFE